MLHCRSQLDFETSDWVDCLLVFDRQYRVYSHLLLVADVAVGVPALFLAYFLRSHAGELIPSGLGGLFNPELLPFRQYLLYFLALLPLWVLLLLITQRYFELVYLPLRQQFIRALHFALAAGVVTGFFTFALNLVVSRPIFFGFVLICSSLVALNRVLIQWVLRSRNINEHNQIKIVVVGTDSRSTRVGEVLENSQKYGYHVVGHVSCGAESVADSSLNLLGSLEDLPRLLVDEVVADEIIFVEKQGCGQENIEELMSLCEDLGIKTRLALDGFPKAGARPSLEFLAGLPLITYSTVPDHSLSLVAKRLLDCSAAACLLLVTTPIMLVVMLLIKFTSPGSIFYSQIRCGLYGRRFTLTKFRTMIEGAEDKLWEIKHLNEMDGPVFKMRNDPRVTPLGRILRKFSIDELPQLANVLKGEMSLVGPRAPLPEEVKYYSLKHRRRLSVKPGITCLWQVSGRNEIDFQGWMDLDLRYIDHWSLGLDLVILLKTIPAVLKGRGAS